MKFHRLLLAAVPTCAAWTVSAHARPFVTPSMATVAGWLPALAALCAVAVADERKSADAHLDDARRFIAQNQHNDALQSMEMAVSADAGNYLVRFRRAAMLLTMGRNQAALEDFNRILELKPDFDQALLQRAKIFLKDCQLDKARDDLESLLTRSPDSDEVKVLLTEATEAQTSLRAANEASDDDTTIAALGVAIHTCSQDSQLRLRRARAYEAKGDLELAVNDFTWASKLRTNDIDTLLHLARLQTKLGEVEHAVGSVKQCLQYDPEQKQCAKLFKQLKKLTKAITRANDSMSRNRHREALGEDGFDVERKSANGALTLIDQMAVGGAAKRRVLNSVCDCYVQLKSTDRIIKWCSEAIDADPERLENYCARGDAYIIKEELDSALRDFNKAGEGGQNAPRCAREGMGKVQQLQRNASRKDYYKILEVSRDADQREIKKAYRAMALKYHPDRFDGDQDEAQKRMADINLAYEVLGDADTRKRYDAGEDPNDPTGGHGGGGGHHHHNPFGQHVVFQQGGGSPFEGFGGGGFQFHF